MISRLKRILAFLLCMSLCAYSAYRGLQWLGIAGLLATLCVLYSRQAARAFTTTMDLLKQTREAKIGALELRTQQRQPNAFAGKDTPPWAATMIAELSSEEVGMLLSLFRQQELVPNAATKKHLRPLRDRGLVAHDKPTLEDSVRVTLTALGAELATLLFRTQRDPIQPVVVVAGTSAALHLPPEGS